MNTAGLAESLLPLDELDVDRLIDGVHDLVDRVPAVYRLIDDAVEGRRGELDEQYALIARLVDRGRHHLGEPEANPS